MAQQRTRDERLQIMLSPEELGLVEDFRFKARMPSRASAVRELLRRPGGRGLRRGGGGIEVLRFRRGEERPVAQAIRRRAPRV